MAHRKKNERIKSTENSLQHSFKKSTFTYTKSNARANKVQTLSAKEKTRQRKKTVPRHSFEFKRKIFVRWNAQFEDISELILLTI